MQVQVIDLVSRPIAWEAGQVTKMITNVCFLGDLKQLQGMFVMSEDNELVWMCFCLSVAGSFYIGCCTRFAISQETSSHTSFLSTTEICLFFEKSAFPEKHLNPLLADVYRFTLLVFDLEQLFPSPF